MLSTPMGANATLQLPRLAYQVNAPVRSNSLPNLPRFGGVFFGSARRRGGLRVGWALQLSGQIAEVLSYVGVLDFPLRFRGILCQSVVLNSLVQKLCNAQHGTDLTHRAVQKRLCTPERKRPSRRGGLPGRGGSKRSCGPVTLRQRFRSVVTRRCSPCFWNFAMFPAQYVGVTLRRLRGRKS